ncbi:MAG: dihydrodipicolinate synthase family protein [Maritimibacter sp.]|nr:dihydrodipicolinate synthase family protein [Maritimibacter sp.]
MSWHGIYPIIYAFWGEDGRLDRAAMARQVDYCIANGAHGIAVLGLVTEVHKMDVNERLHLVEMVGDMIAGRVPYAVTVAEPSTEGQIAFARSAAAAGADWVILQPPPVKGTSQADLIRFFGTVADAVDVDVAVQNNPVNLDVSLSADGLVALNRAHPNIRILKGEGWSVDIDRAIAGSDGAFAVFGGHGGIEFPALLQSGGAGLIPAPDFLPAQVAMYEMWRDGRTADALDIHRRLLPAIVFMSRSVPGMLCYGKRLFAAQADIDIRAERAPFKAPSDFGLEQVAGFAEDIRTAVNTSGPHAAALSAAAQG